MKDFDNSMGYLSTLIVAAQETPTESPGFEQFLPMFALLVVAFWFIMVRPEKKQRREHEAKLEAMTKGDRVVSAGGIHGKVVDVDKTNKVIKVEVAPKIVMKFSMSSISVVKSDAKASSEQGDESGKKK